MRADDRHGGRGQRLEGWLEGRGGLGGFVFFGCLVLFDDGQKAPVWVIWPAFALMIVGVFGRLLMRINDGRRTRKD